MNILFRVDASLQMGTGHVMRCLTLAQALRDRGAHCRFICREHPGHLLEPIRQAGFEAIALPPADQSDRPSPPADQPLLAHAPWLGATWAEDAAQTIAALGEDRPDWLIVDHYALDHRWQAQLRPHCGKIMVIDDLADRAHDCDLLLDQNLGRSATRYHGLVSSRCKQLYSTDYALLKPVYAERRAQLSERDGLIRRVLIYFGGGSEAVNLTAIALQVFQSAELAKIEVDIVVHGICENNRLLEKIITQRGHTTIHKYLPDLADLMANADLAIGAGGATTWERCCMGLPTILVVCASNQETIGKSVSEAGAAFMLNHNDDLPTEIERLVVNLQQDVNAYFRMSSSATAICDGLGVIRVCKELI